MKNALTGIGTLLIIISITFSYFNRENIIVAFSDPVDIYEDYPSDYSKVTAVETHLGMLLDIFCEEKTLTRTNGSITKREYDYYYIAPVFTESNNETYYVGVKVNSQKSMLYDKAVNATWSYLNYETDSFTSIPISFRGGFFKMEDELYKYFKEWFVKNNYFENEADSDKYLLPLVLEPMDYESMKITACVMAALCIIGIIMIIIGIHHIRKELGLT